jgi:hypothetical protein
VVALVPGCRSLTPSSLERQAVAAGGQIQSNPFEFQLRQSAGMRDSGLNDHGVLPDHRVLPHRA